jgi:hypothetical protein
MENGKLSRIEQYRQERKPSTFPGISLKRPAWGILKFKCWQEEKKPHPGRCDMAIITPQ